MCREKILLVFISIFITTISFGQPINHTWVKSFSGPSNMKRPNAITVDDNGNVYSAGSFVDSVDFDPSAGVFSLSSTNSNPDMYVSKLNVLGGLDWALKIGGSGEEQVNAMALDGDGNVYLGGYFTGIVDFNPGPDTFSLTSVTTSYEGFICKLKPNGDFAWAISLGGTGFDQVLGLDLDANANVYATGYFYDSVDFDPGPNVFSITTTGLSDMFVTKYDSSANLIWAKSMGGNSVDVGYSISVDMNNRPHITGYYNQTADFDPDSGVFNLTSTGGKSVFITRLNQNGGLDWAKTFTGGSNDKIGRGITVDDLGCVYSTGLFAGTADFDPGSSSFSLTASGNSDVFISKLNPNGDFLWAKSMGGASDDVGYSVTVGNNHEVYTSGYYNGTIDLDPGLAIDNRTTNGLSDIFISQLDSNGNYLNGISIGGVGEEEANAMAQNGSNIYVTGIFEDSVDFNPNANSDILSATGVVRDIFIHKLRLCNTSFVPISPTACTSYTSPSSNYTWTTSGTYTDTVVFANGCDSIYTINLTIVLDTTIIQNGDTLTANANSTATQFQWLDCNNNYAAIPGATNQSFVPAIPGSYAVAITEGSCAYISPCYNVAPVGLQDIQMNAGIQVYPNPVKDVVRIKSKGPQINRVEIFDTHGKKLRVIEGNLTCIKTTDIPSGLYFLRIRTVNNQTYYKKLCKQ